MDMYVVVPLDKRGFCFGPFHDPHSPQDFLDEKEFLHDERNGTWVDPYTEIDYTIKRVFKPDEFAVAMSSDSRRERMVALLKVREELLAKQSKSASD